MSKSALFGSCNKRKTKWININNNKYLMSLKKLKISHHTEYKTQKNTKNNTVRYKFKTNITNL